MTLCQKLHAARIKPPFYQTGGDAGCGLHRYLDTDFVNRFRQDIQRRQFHGPQFNEWLRDERHSRFGREPVLRLPLHRAFHLVSCEVICDHLGSPAVDPKKIASAGFVIRRIEGGTEQAWMIEDGQALGWQPAPSELRDPDIHRRLCASGVLHPRADEPAYSGEEVHPLHVLKTTDAAGKIHTLLYGYLPLGGFYYHRNPVAAIDSQSSRAVEDAAGAALPWPFGFARGHKPEWRTAHGAAVDHGRPSPAMLELLRLLVNRYHLGEPSLEANLALERRCADVWFHHTGALPDSLRREAYTDASRALFIPYRSVSLLEYLQKCAAAGGANPLVRWLARQEKRMAANGGPGGIVFDPLPNAAGNGSIAESLWVSEADAQELRTLLGQRLREQTLALVKEIPLPKFTQGEHELYQVVPLVRVINPQGREQIHWADASARSLLFRVAAPFDPEASRPSMIQMPSLADLRRGLAKGAAMITPADTFNLISSLKMDKGVTADAVPESEPPPGLGIQWICSFSLPVVTLIAMILLMIMVTLLNIIFFWLPWVRICLPFPKVK
jgi:hypothetical protein